jgi:glucose/arabinose dehydrogenase
MSKYSDDWCCKNTVAPVMALQAHSAPLGMTFFKYKNWPKECKGGLDKSFDGDAFVAYHGSWNRDIPTGYKVVRIPMNDKGLPSIDQPIDFMWHEGNAKFPSGIRPVDLEFDKCGRLLITSDGTRPNGKGSMVLMIMSSAFILKYWIASLVVFIGLI